MIRGKVAKILNSRELVINRGSEQDVTVGMVFDVMDPVQHEVVDPDTKDVLGSVERPKVRIRVVTVQPNLSVARTFRTRQVNVGGTGDLFAGRFGDMFAPPKWVERPETLRTNEATWESLSEQQSFVKTGDPVVQVDVDQETELLS